MSHATGSDLLVVRTLGYADVPRIVHRLGLSDDDVRDHLLDAQAHGWATWSSYADQGGWSLTETGKAHGERQLADELDSTGARSAVTEVYQEFLHVNDETTDPGWITGTDRDSCHRVWFELHEDLIPTLGLAR